MRRNKSKSLEEAISVLEKLTRGSGATVHAADATSRQARSFRGRAPENFSGPESALGQDQTDEEGSLNAGRAAGSRSSPLARLKPAGFLPGTWPYTFLMLFSP